VGTGTAKLMLWEEILLSRSVDDAELLQALSAALGVPRDSVLVVATMADAPPPGKHTRCVVVERTPTRGDFVLQLSIYVFDQALLDRLGHADQALAAVRQICAVLECDGLISDDSLSPTTWLRIRSSGSMDTISLDGERLDDDEYVLTFGPEKRQAPLRAQPT
jgi:hypothetical protein